MKNIKRKTHFLKSLFIHTLCHCLFLVPFAHAQQSLVQEAGPVTDIIVDKKAKKSNKELQENLKHESIAKENGGLNSKCDEETNDTIQAYLDREEYLDASTQQNLELITSRRNQLLELTGGLNTAEGVQSESDPVATKEIEELNKKAAEAKKEMEKQKKLLSTFPPKDKDNYDPEREKVFYAYQAARSKYYSLRKQAANKEALVNTTITHVTTVQDTQALSDAISGCSGGGSTKTCELSGTLYEKDKELTRLANENIDIAISLAKEKSDALLDLELEREYNGDYKLFQSAILMGNSGEDLDDINNLSQEQWNQRTQTEEGVESMRSIGMIISNIKTLAMSSAGVKDLKCTKDPKSEADSKSYHLFRAAAATFIMAQINDTGLYTDASSCRATEEYTSDEKNLQIRTLERAANLTQEQLENICLRVNPTPPANPYDWKLYGNTEALAQKNISKLTSLKEECDAYLEKLRGPEYVGKPRTREAALEMMNTAYNLAIEELAAKREKVATAHANIQKGEAWIKRVKSYIVTMLAMAAALKLAASYLYSLPWCAGCAKGSSLMKKALYIIAIVVGVYLISELARAKAFLKKWEKKMDLAKSFTHLECNYAQAVGEESAILEMSTKAKEEMLKEVEETRNNTIEDVNILINTSPTTQVEIPTTTFLDFMMELIPTAHADTPTVTKRDDKRLSRSLGVAYGSESFRFFLAQKIEHWKIQSSHILEKNNTSNKVLKTRDQLVAPFIDGTGDDPLDGLTEYEKNGFPVPETRVVTIANAVALMTDNIGRTNGVIGDIADQRENYLELLNEFRNRLNIKAQGLSDNDQTTQQAAPTQGYCLDSNGELDKDCQCKMNNTCSQFRFKLPEKFFPGALKEEANSSLNHANGILTGNLAKANIAAGQLGQQSNAISDRLLKAKEELNKQRKKVGLEERDIDKEASATNSVVDNNVNLVTSSSSPSGRNQNSPFAKLRNSILGTTPSKTAVQLTNGKEKSFKSFTGFDNESGQGNVLPESKKSTGNETFTFDSGASSSSSNDNDDNQNVRSEARNQRSRYSHIRASNKNTEQGDINSARKKNIFSIISKRYKKTAFPILLLP
jgi:hypothetical protein